MCHSKPLFYFLLFYTVDWKKMLNKFFDDDWFRTAIIWCKKLPLCQLSLNIAYSSNVVYAGESSLIAFSVVDYHVDLSVHWVGHGQGSLIYNLSWSFQFYPGLMLIGTVFVCIIYFLPNHAIVLKMKSFKTNWYCFYHFLL